MSPRYNGGGCEMLFGRDITFGQGLALHDLGQRLSSSSPSGRHHGLFINAHKAVEQNNLTVGAQNDLLIWAGDINGGAFNFAAAIWQATCVSNQII